MFSPGEISEKKKIIYVDFHLQKLLSRSFYSLYYYFPTVDKKKLYLPYILHDMID
jgi:hypothetical protein